MQWIRLNCTFPDLPDVIIRKMEDHASEITVSRDLNFSRWDILGEKISAGSIPLGSYEAEYACDEEFLRAHLAGLTSAIRKIVETAQLYL